MRNLTFDSVLKKGQKLNFVSKSNISAGGEIKNYSEEVSQETKDWVKKLVDDLQIRICGIDIFVGDSINNPKSFSIIEVNHNPQLLGIYEIGEKKKVLQIWKRILQKFFEGGYSG